MSDIYSILIIILHAFDLLIDLIQARQACSASRFCIGVEALIYYCTEITLHAAPINFFAVSRACQLANLPLDNGFASIDFVLMASGLRTLLPSAAQQSPLLSLCAKLALCKTPLTLLLPVP